MLRSIFTAALPLVSGHGLKAIVRRLAGRAALWLAAGVLTLAALCLGLVSAYAALQRYGLAAHEAAGILAAGLLCLAAIIVVFDTLRNRRSARVRFAGGSPREAPAQAGLVDQQLAQAVQQIGPASMLAAAFVVGVTAGRRIGNGR